MNLWHCSKMDARWNHAFINAHPLHTCGTISWYQLPLALPSQVANRQYSTCWIVWYARMTVHKVLMAFTRRSKKKNWALVKQTGLLLYCHMTLLNVNMLYKQVYKHPINTDDNLAKQSHILVLYKYWNTHTMNTTIYDEYIVLCNILNKCVYINLVIEIFFVV